VKCPAHYQLHYAMTVVPLFEQWPHLQCACEVNLQENMKLRISKEEEDEK